MDSSKTPVYRIFLIATLSICLAALIFLVDRRKNATEDLSSYFENINTHEQSMNLIDSCVEASLTTESLFRSYAIKRDEKSKNRYLRELEKLSKLLNILEDSLIAKEVTGGTSLTSLLKDKSIKTGVFLRLKQLNDSLIKSTIILNDAQFLLPNSGNISLKQVRIFVKKTDSIITAPLEKQSRGLVKRVKEAILNNEQTDKNKININSSTQVYTDQERKVQKELNSLLSQTISKLAKSQEQLNAKEMAVVLANDQLLQELSAILKKLSQTKEILIATASERLARKAESSFYHFDELSLWILGLGFFLVLLILFNIWKQYLYEKQIVAAKKSAEKQVKIRKDFLAHMSHEIRTPLNAILGFSEQLEMSELSVEQVEKSNAIRESSQILLAVVNDILDLSKLEAGNLNLQLAPFLPRKAIKNVLSSLKVLTETKKLELVFNCDFDEKLKFTGDEFRLKQVLVNLINNAIKFTDKGSVTVNAAIINQTILKVEVVDTGKGIPKSDIDNIFDEFSQVHNSSDRQRGNGTGLGLAICKKIILAQKGNIKVKSEVNTGSVFSIEIPFQSVEIKAEVNSDVVKK